MPTNIEDYVHRIGRTGRGGNSGVAISFINESNKPIINDLYSILKKLNQEIPEWFEKLYNNYRDYKPCNKYIYKLAGSYYNKYQINSGRNNNDKRNSFLGKRERNDSKHDEHRSSYSKSYSNTSSGRREYNDRDRDKHRKY